MTTLLVPMALEVLMVRAATIAAATAMTVPNPPPANPTFHELTPPPFGAGVPRPAGAHLKWSLPSALTAAKPAADGSGPPVFAALPQRWLILRLSGDVTAGPRSVAAWLVANVDVSPAVVVSDALTAAWPAPPAPPASPLTALGTGDLAWAGYYDNVANILGFHDPLTGVAGSVSYLVCGWYLYSQFDPLNGATTDDQVSALGWSAPDGPVPTSTLLHGAAVGLGWPEPPWPGDGGTLSAEGGGPPDPATIGLALADTIAEAAIALGVQPGDDPSDQLLLQATMDGMLSQLAAVDGPAKLDTTLHASRFQAVPITDGNDSEAIWQPNTETTTVPPSYPTDTGVFVDADRTQPRLFAPVDPAIVISDAGRSYSHGGDGRFTSDGTVACRLPGMTVTWAGASGTAAPDHATILGGVQAQLQTVGAPADVWDLLLETAALDPSGPPDLAAATPTAPSPDSSARAAWLADPTATPPALVGTLPSPVAIHAAELAWTPMHLEWALDWARATDGVHAFTLGAVDFATPDSSTLPATDAGATYLGRCSLSSAASAIAAGGAAAALTHLDAAGLLDDHPLSDHLASLVAPRAAAGGHAAVHGAEGAIAEQDLLSGSLQDFLSQLRGSNTGAVIGPPTSGTGAKTTNPTEPDPIRAGILTLVRARVVDAFGQTVDLAGSDGQNAANLSRIAIGIQERIDGDPGRMLLVPRLNAPARVMLRWVSAAGDRTDASTSVSPVCGFFVPSPLDGSVEFFDADGAALGRLRPDETRGTVWEEDPGQPASLGAKPSASIPNPFLGAFADGLIAADSAQAATAGAGAQTALQALSLLTDATRWTVSPGGAAGDEHLSLLLGRPVAVLRAGIMVDVHYPARGSLAPTTAIPVKLGTLAHTQDGVLGYFVSDDYRRVHAVDPSLADVEASDGSTITAPYVDTSPSVGIQPGVGVDLTVLIEPATDMHCTVGLLPQKDIGMRRDWVAGGLAQLTPNWRYGPVLVDPKATRIPVPTDIHGQWFWNHRSDPTTWPPPATIVNATTDAILGDLPHVAQEGWTRLALSPDPEFPGIPFHVTNITQRIPGPQHRIDGIGACTDPENGTGQIWWLATDDAITMVSSGRFYFYVTDPDGNNRAQVIVGGIGPSGRPFLQTVGDANTANNLDGLPLMPAPS